MYSLYKHDKKIATLTLNGCFIYIDRKLSITCKEALARGWSVKVARGV